MKKILLITAIIIFSLLPANAYYQTATQPAGVTPNVVPRINLGLNYNYNGSTAPQAHPINHIVVGTYGTPNTITLPPPPPPKKYHQTYKNYAGHRNFHHRSYYVPSYCMPYNEYTYIRNPFCNQYRPYGSNMYIGF